MTDTPRFRVIDGGKGKPATGKAPRERLKSRRPETVTKVSGPNLTEQWEHYKCGECSDALGFTFTQLHEVRIGTISTSARGSAGKVISGQTWLACPRCHQLRFQLEGRSPANDGPSHQRKHSKRRPAGQES